MSSTSGVQNFLVNVFRPVYTYDATTTLFTPKLELSNIDTYSGNSISVFTASVGDGSNNCYVGKFAGNDYTAIKACSNVTALGVSAGSGISNVSNSTFLGYSAGLGASNASSNVAVGTNANGNGTSNVYVGAGTGSAGSSNIFLGAAITGSGTGSILIGPGLTDASTNSLFKLGTTYLTGNLSTKWLGLGTLTPIDSNSRFDVSGNAYFGKQVGIQMAPERTLDVNGDFRASDGNGTMDISGGLTTSTNGFASARGTIAVSGGVTTIGTLKKGLVIVSALDTASSNNRASRILFAHTTSNATDTGSNIAAGNTSITLSTSNIRITDATNATYAWSITYFPLP